MLTRWYGGKGRREVAGGDGEGRGRTCEGMGSGRGEGKKGGERAERVAGGGGVRKCSERGRQEVRSQVRGGDNDELCFSAAPDGNQEKGGKADARAAVEGRATFFQCSFGIC